jgi:phosphatidylglycerol---prolipoprotein diacylglyceryl transferase
VFPVLAELRWPILERIPIVGDFQVSPHGIMIAVGFLLGAQVLLKRAQQRGVARRPIKGVDLIVQSVLTRVAIGSILGARFFYVATRLDQFPDPLGWFRIWEGGLSLLGGIAGGIIAAIPYVRRRRLSVPLMLDSAAPGLALGIFVGRIGDLIIGEHLGDRTDFFLGWRCTGAFRDPGAPHPFTGPQVQGCFDAAVHQFAILLLLERKPRFDGFFMAAFAVLYGTGRFITDFAREADKDMVGTLTGSQLAALATITAVLLWFLLTRPDRRRPYAWDPPEFAHPWDEPGESDSVDEADGEAIADGRAETPAGGYSSADGPR